MRLLSLHLTRYGPFEDHRVTFDATPGCLNLLYAPNGAGKSVLRQAFGDLLFGIPGQSKMDFRFGYEGMRLTAEAVAPDNSHFIFGRRKGIRNTLLDGAGQPDTSGRLAALLGEADKSLLERLFAIDTERLREGGQQLLDSGGSVADALLAGGGLRGAKVVRQALEADVDNLAPSNKRAKSPFKLAVDALLKARADASKAVLTPEKWAKLEAERAEAERERGGHNAVFAEANRQISRLERLRRVRIPMATRDAAAEWLAANPDAPNLPATLGAKLTNAARGVRDCEQQLIDATARHADFAKERDAISLQQNILDAAEDIERLNVQAGAVSKALIDIPQRQADRNTLIVQIEQHLRRLNSDIRPDQAAKLVPHRAAEKRARALIARHREVAAAVEQSSARLTAFSQHIADTTTALAALPAFDGVEELAPLMAEIQAGGNPGAAANEAARAAETSRAALDAALAAVGGWTGDAADLLALPVLPEETYERLDQVRRAAAAALALDTSLARTAAEAVEQARKHLASIIGGATVADDDAITQARRHRDRGWQLIYRLAFAGDPPDPAESAAFAGDQPLPLAYQSAVQTADTLADRRVLQAGVIADATAARRRLAEAEQAAQTARLACRPGEDQVGQAERAWSQACASLPAALTRDTAPGLDEVRSFLRARQAVIERARDLQRDDLALHRLSRQHEGWATRLAAALTPTAIPTLAGLLAEAKRRLSDAEAAAKKRISLEASLHEHRRAHAAEQTAYAQAQTRFASWQAEWQVSLAELGRPSDDTPEITAEILTVLSDLDKDVSTVAGLEQRLADMASDNSQFRAAVATALRTAAPDLVTLDALAAFRVLHGRLQEQQTNLALRAGLQKQVDKTGRELTLLRHQLIQRQGELLAVLSDIGAKTIEDAAERLSVAHERATHTAALIAAEQRLREESDGLDIAQLRAELAEVPIDDITARLSEAEARVQAANGAAQIAAARAQQLRADMDQVAGDMSYEGFIAHQHGAIATIDRVLEEALLARLSATLLHRAMVAVETQSGSVMLGRISRYVHLLTAGAYAKVVTEDNGAGGVDLALLPADLPYEQKTVDQLSEGTRDQLYLALRLAAIEEHVASATALPFIGDDILQTSDNTRASAALAALLELSHHVQIIILTHHPHIIDLGRTLPAGAVHVCKLAPARQSVAAQ